MTSNDFDINAIQQEYQLKYTKNAIGTIKEHAELEELSIVIYLLVNGHKYIIRIFDRFYGQTLEFLWEGSISEFVDFMKEKNLEHCVSNEKQFELLCDFLQYCYMIKQYGLR